MPRCCRFFAPAKREEDADLCRDGGMTDEQRRRSEKAAQPEGRGRFRVSGFVAYSSQDMLLASALPFRQKRSRAAWLSNARGSYMPSSASCRAQSRHPVAVPTAYFVRSFTIVSLCLE
jgi:hypothetical protein